MSKILKNSYQPLDDTLISLSSFDGYLSTEDIINVKNMPNNIDENGIVEERDKIEKCASLNKVYFYNSNWDQESVGQLKEYATVCKCKIAGVDPNSSSFSKKAYHASKMQKEASVTVKENSSPLIMDPFNLDREINTSYLAKDKSWDKLHPESKISKPSIFNKSHNVVGVDSEEDYFKNVHLRVRRGQNSVTNPDAIESMVNDDSKDVGLRIRNERKEQETGRKSEIVASEKKIVQDAKDKGFGSLPNNGVKLIESMNAQPGIKNQDIFHLDVPDETDGEKLVKQNEQRKASIQREIVKDEKLWDEEQPQATHEISDVFTESLRKNLKNIKK